MNIRQIYRRLPNNVKLLLRNAYFSRVHWANPTLKKFGTVQDLYYWVCDDELDTVMLLQNYFSAFYPSLNSQTQGLISIYDKDGELLGTKSFSLARYGGVKFRISNLLRELQVQSINKFGTLEVNIEIPKEVLRHISDYKSFYFWDRFYICYTNAKGHVSFMHGVDKAHIYQYANKNPRYWYTAPGNHEWAPEIPVDMADYSKFSVIMINRTPSQADVTLTLWDRSENSLSWSTNISSKAVHRFELTKDVIAGLDQSEMRMRVSGMPSRFGRPVVFKEFPNGAISAMHC